MRHPELDLDVQIHPTESFYRCVAGLRDELQHSWTQAEEVESALGTAIRRIEDYPWPSDLPIEKRGSALNEYEYRFHPSYRMTFRWRGDRRRGELVRVHLYLKAIYREP